MEGVGDAVDELLAKEEAEEAAQDPQADQQTKLNKEDYNSTTDQGKALQS